MIRMSRKAKKAMAVALTAGMLASTAITPVMAATQGWKQNSKGWWYQNADGSYPANKWSQINGVWYYFDANGYMLANSWVKDSKGDWYYVGANGAMLKNAWAQDKAGLWYWMTDDGSMFEGGWAKIKGQWYFFSEAGAMQSGVITVEGKTYFLGASNDGAMKEGEQTIAATKYNFAEKDGYCTDATVPAADKHFDAKGKEIIPEVEVEQVSDLTCEITNALADYKEYGNVVIAGDNAYLKILVTDAKGNPVVNTPVAIKKEHRAGSYDSYDPHSYVQTTNSEGYATFVFSADAEDDIDATTAASELMTITATAVQINKSKTIDLTFAYVDLGDVSLRNHYWHDDSLVEVPSKNADASVHGIAYTESTDDYADIEYVVSQQASDKGADNHKVEFEVNPCLVIPYGTKDITISEYSQEINKEIKEYSVYEDGKDAIKIENIPAGLRYISLDFAKMDISEYSHVEIQKYIAGTGTKAGDPYIIKGATTKNNSTYQIPVQNKTTEYDIVVKIVSKGQVDDDQNGGIVLSKVYGPYESNKRSDVATPSFGTVTWSQTEIKYSDEKKLDYADAVSYIPNDVDMQDKYVNAKYTYTYQVPAFPYVGNAVMTVKDENKKIIAYFTIPTANQYKGTVIQNENDIMDPVSGENKAILVSADEAFGKEGTITQEGNKVIVNSEKTGITALQAKISIQGYEDKINLINDTLYTSVQWSPLPNEVVSGSAPFYALVGQDIVVKAQLVDKNGNKVTQAGEEIKFKYADGKQIDKIGAIGTTLASASDYKANTDANGQTTLKITSADDLALVDSLYAESEKYDVQLTIGDQTVTKATLRWVNAGLSFTDRTDKVPGVQETIDTLDQTTDIDSVLDGENGYLVKDAGTNWIFGYEVVGETQNKDKFYISGLKVDVTKGGEGTLTTTGVDNGVAKLTSKATGITTLTGTVNEKSVVNGTDVLFHIGNDTFKNVGEGTASINASLNLPINWGNVGTSVEIISPKGTKIVHDGDEKIYVKAVDELGNDLVGQEVEIRLTYNLADGTSKEANCDGNYAEDAVFTTPSEANGLVDVTLLDAIGGSKVKSVVIVAKVGNAEPARYTINYETITGVIADIAIGDVVYEEQTSTSNPKVRVIFTTNIDKTTLRKEMFAITDAGDNKLNIASVELDANRQNEVIITLSNTHAAGLDYTETYTVTATSYKDPVTQIVYDLCDTYFRPIVNQTDSFVTADVDLETARKLVAAAVAQEIADKEADIANDNTDTINTVAGNINTAVKVDDGYADDQFDVGTIDANGATVTVTEGEDAKNILTITDNKIKVAPSAEAYAAEATATFTIKVTKGTGAQAGTTSTKTYKVTLLSAASYKVDEVTE